MSGQETHIPPRETISETHQVIGILRVGGDDGLRPVVRPKQVHGFPLQISYCDKCRDKLPPLVPATLKVSRLTKLLASSGKSCKKTGTVCVGRSVDMQLHPSNDPVREKHLKLRFTSGSLVCVKVHMLTRI